MRNRAMIHVYFRAHLRVSNDQCKKCEFKISPIPVRRFESLRLVKNIVLSNVSTLLEISNWCNFQIDTISESQDITTTISVIDVEKE